MQKHKKEVVADKPVLLILVLLNAIIIKQGFVDNPSWYAMLVLSIPLLAISMFLYKRR